MVLHGQPRQAGGAWSWRGRRRGPGNSPNENFLEALVLANVTKPQQFGRFLSRLYERYGIVIGDVQASWPSRTPHVDGAVQGQPDAAGGPARGPRVHRRKSDDCAFVRNPYHRAGEPGRASRRAEVTA